MPENERPPQEDLEIRNADFDMLEFRLQPASYWTNRRFVLDHIRTDASPHTTTVQRRSLKPELQLLGGDAPPSVLGCLVHERP